MDSSILAISNHPPIGVLVVTYSFQVVSIKAAYKDGLD